MSVFIYAALNEGGDRWGLLSACIMHANSLFHVFRYRREWSESASCGNAKLCTSSHFNMPLNVQLATVLLAAQFRLEKLNSLVRKEI